MVNSQWLQTFTTLVEQGHFTKTAHELNMTQPGVSQHIQKLEEAIGYKLLNKVGKGFELTREGQILYDYALEKIELEAGMFDRLDSEDEYSGSIKIACSGSLAMLIYPLFLERQIKYPNLKISVEAVPNYLVKSKVMNNEVDIGISTSAFNTHLLEERKIGAEELCIVYPKGLRLTHNSLYDSLAKLGFIDHPDGRFYLERFLNENLDVTGDLKEIQSVTYINQINQILIPVSMGLGFTVMPRKYVESISLRSKVSIFTSKRPIYDPYFLIHKKNKVFGKRYNWFMDQIINIVSK